jgi:hypothetical protein
MPSASTEAECFSACTPFFYASWNEVNTESRCQCFDAGWTFSQSQYSCEDPGVRRVRISLPFNPNLSSFPTRTFTIDFVSLVAYRQLYTHTPGDDSAGSLPPSPPATPEIADTPVLTECSAESISTNSCPPPTDGAGGWNPIGCFGRITPNVSFIYPSLLPHSNSRADWTLSIRNLQRSIQLASTCSQRCRIKPSASLHAPHSLKLRTTSSPPSSASATTRPGRGRSLISAARILTFEG